MKKATAFCGIILGAFLMGTTVQAETVTRAMNFRSEPSVTGSLIGSVPKDAEVTVLSSQNGWDQISYNGVKGWIHGGNVTGKAAAQTTSASGSTSAASAAAGSSGESVKVLYGMNFRATPGMNGRIMGGIPKGTTVQYLGSSNGWDKVVYNGTTGWIASGRTTAASTPAATSQGSSASTAGSAAGTSGQFVKVLYGMNFRETPGMNGRIMGGIPKGTTVQYLGSSNGWDKVGFNGVIGWIASGRTTAVSSTSQEAIEASLASKPYTLSSEAGTILTVITAMNFRATGDLGGTLLGVIPAGAKVTYVSSADGWQQIIYNGKAGWIKGGNTR